MARPRLRRGSSSGDAPSGDAPAGIGPQQVVERTLNQINPGRLEAETRKKRLDAAYDVWRGNTGLNVRQQGNDWQSRMRVKYGMQVIDQALVNIAQGIPRAVVTPRRPIDEDAAKAMGQLLGYYADLDHLAEQEALVCQQALVYGISPAKNCWLYREQDATSYEPALADDGTPVWQPTTRRVVTDDRPSFEPWDAYAIWWDPNARDVDSCSYIVLQSWMTRDQLEQRRYDEDSETGTYRNLDMLYGLGEGTKPPSTAQNRMMTIPQGAYKGRFEILEVWRKTAAGMRTTTIGNRQVLLRDGNGPYWMKDYPITISNSRPDISRIEGISEAELVDHLQQAMWTVQNLRMEQLKMTVMRGMTVRQTVPDLASLIYRPSFQWVVTDHDDVQFQEPPPLPPEAYRETETMLSQLQYVTGITPYVGGASGTTTGVDQTTATGVSLLTESASRLLQFKASIIRQRTWQRTFQQWADLTKQYLRRPQAIRIVGPDGAVSWQLIGPEAANGDFDIRVTAGEEAAARAQDRADAVALMNALAPFVQAGQVNPQPLIEKIAEAFGIRDPASLLSAMQQTPAAAPNGQLPAAPPPSLLGGPPGLAGGNGQLAQHPPMSVLRGNR